MGKKKRVVIDIPMPMPTWNRLFAMQPFLRKKTRHLLHAFVSLSITHGTDWPTQMDYQGKLCSTELLKLEYLQAIRPSKSRKYDIANLKAKLKAQES